jgi:hypothetical protein
VTSSANNAMTRSKLEQRLATSWKDHDGMGISSGEMCPASPEGAERSIFTDYRPPVQVSSTFRIPTLWE